MDGAPEAAPRYRVVSSHSGADFEAGRLGHRNGEAPNDGAEHEVVNAQLRCQRIGSARPSSPPPPSTPSTRSPSTKRSGGPCLAPMLRCAS